MDKVLNGKVAVVTGAGRGIGRAIALEMAKQGAKIVANDLGGEVNGTGSSTTPAEEVAKEIKALGGDAVANYASVATTEGAESIIKDAIDNFGKIDILANVAGVQRDRMIFNMTDEEWDMVIKVHLYGHFYCTRAACWLMRQQGSGRIINISSIAALGNAGQANYAAAKAGIIGFTKTVAKEMAKYNVTCNCVMPQAATRMTASPEMKAAFEKKAVAGDSNAQALLKEWGKRVPEDNSPLVVYLASDAASYVNGCVFWVKGGVISRFGEMEVVKQIYKPERWTVEELITFMPESLVQP